MISSLCSLAPRYPVQFNAARIDTLPVFPHDQGWAVYDSELKLPLALNFRALEYGAARSSTCNEDPLSPNPTDRTLARLPAGK